MVSSVTMGSRYEIRTPSASALVRGTLFATRVDEVGSTLVRTTEGAVLVTAQNQEVVVQSGQQTNVGAGSSPPVPQLSPEPEREFVIVLSGPVSGSITNPNGASSGVLPSGLTFNQIPGSRYSLGDKGTQIISIREPATGEYKNTLRGTSDGEVYFVFQGKLRGEVVSQHTGTHKVNQR